MQSISSLQHHTMLELLNLTLDYSHLALEESTWNYVKFTGKFNFMLRMSCKILQHQDENLITVGVAQLLTQPL